MSDSYLEAKPRIPNQLLAVKRLMEDGQWRTLREIARATHYPESSVSARLRDLRKPPYNRKVERVMSNREGIWKYRLVPEPGLLISGRNNLVQIKRPIQRERPLPYAEGVDQR